MKVYYPSINLLRGIAALMVCFYHFSNYSGLNGSLFDSSSWMSQLGVIGSKGVYVFFVISGFVIPLSLYKYNYTWKKLGRFLTRRFIRIEIPYFFSILLILGVSLYFTIKSQTEFDGDWKRIAHHLFYSIPFSSYEWYNIIYWTLAIEFQFYIFMGLIYFFLVHGRKLIGWSTLLIFVSLGLLINDDRFLFFYSPIFALGILIFMYKVQKTDTWIFILFTILFSSAILVHFPIIVAILSLLTSLAILLLEVDTKLTNLIGNISFSLYLTHGVIGNNILLLLFSETMSFTQRIFVMLLAFAGSMLFAYVFWRFVEKPSQDKSKLIHL